jgi:hypothetical protein
MTEREKKLLAHILWMEKVIYEKENAFAKIFDGEMNIFDVRNDSWLALRNLLGIYEASDWFIDILNNYVNGKISIQDAIEQIDEVVKRG